MQYNKARLTGIPPADIARVNKCARSTDFLRTTDENKIPKKLATTVPRETGVR